MLQGNTAPPEMTTLEYEIWREFVRQRCGLYFPESRLRFLRQRLWERLCHLHLRSYSEYYHYVAFNSGGESEWKELLELLLNQETGFFRHLPSFEALMEHALPQLMRDKQRRGENLITLWSAGCATGPEAYSLAMAFLETPGSHLWQVQVIGSDLSRRALDKARRGRYKSYEVRYVPDLYRRKYLTTSEAKVPITFRSDGHLAPPTLYQVIEQVRGLVQFNYVNLVDPESYPLPIPFRGRGGQDVIFCQNVLIYFKPESRVAIVRRLCQRLNAGGYLFLAPAEVVGLHREGQVPDMRLVRLPDSLIYRKHET